jgi:N-acetylglucosamine malate deacetylase 1
MEDQDRLDVIAVGAHPDDVEIACGGTLARLAKQGYRVGIVDLTDGEPTPLCPSPDVRLAEAAAAANELGVHRRVTLELPNRRLFDDFESRIALAKLFRRFRPRVVIGMGAKTPMASPDHDQAVRIIDAAIFYSRLSKWENFFDGLPTHSIDRQVYYHLGFDFSIPIAGGVFTMDIGDELECKLASIACYATQFPPEKAHIFDRVRALAMSVGSAAGFRAGETFVSTKPIGSTSLMQVLHLPEKI